MIGLGVKKRSSLLYKSELILNRVYDKNDLNIITINVTLATELELSETILTLAAQMENQTVICSGRSLYLSTK